MLCKVRLCEGGEGIGFEFVDDPEDRDVSNQELRRRLDAIDVGEQLSPSLLAVRGIVARLLADASLLDDVRHTLTLIDQLSQSVLVVNLVETDKTIVESAYRRQILSMQRILAGDALMAKGGIRVPDGVFQTAVVDRIESRHADFTMAAPEQRSKVVADVAQEIFVLAGREPSAAIIREALEVAGRKGRPSGARNGLSSGRGKDEVYNDLLRELGLASTSVYGLKRQRKRSSKRGDT